MKAFSFITARQEATCFLADFEAPRLQTALALYRRGLLPSTALRAGRASPERRARSDGAEVEAPRQARGLIFGCKQRGREHRRTARSAHYSRFVNNAG
jgi:hypothetical protein